MPRTALLLAAYGSRTDPMAGALARGQAEQIRSLSLFDEVGVAFHVGQPRFCEALDTMEAEKIVVVPLMTSAGYTSRVILPRELARSRSYAPERVRITDCVGAHPLMAGLVARRADDVLRQNGLGREATELAIVGHGTRRHAGSRSAAEAVARSLRKRRIFPRVTAAFLEEAPGVEEIVSHARLPAVLVIPFFMAGGEHATRDLPERLGLDPDPRGELPVRGRAGGRLVVCDAPVGGDPMIRDIIMDLADPPGRGRERGEVHLVGAGPGDPGLITVCGLELLRKADVVVYDRLAAPDLLREAPPSARLVDAGKSRGEHRIGQEAINTILVHHALRGRRVVRLKGGDPFVFGRGGEELAACRRHGVRCTVVPGVSSASAAPAAAGIPITQRGLARSVAVVTASSSGPGVLSSALLRSLAGLDTVVILMGRAGLAATLENLVANGKDPQTPAACIERATTPRQRVVTATLSALAREVEREGLEAPVTIVVGEVAALGSPRAEEAFQPFQVVRVD